MKNDVGLEDVVLSIFDTVSEKIAKQQKEAEKYESDWKKKNPLYRNFCKVNKGSQPLQVAEDFACHVLGSVLAKKIAGKSKDELKEIFDDMMEHVIKEANEFNAHYSYLMAMGIAANKKGGSK